MDPAASTKQRLAFMLPSTRSQIVQSPVVIVLSSIYFATACITLVAHRLAVTKNSWHPSVLGSLLSFPALYMYSIHPHERPMHWSLVYALALASVGALAPVMQTGVSAWICASGAMLFAVIQTILLHGITTLGLAPLAAAGAAAGGACGGDEAKEHDTVAPGGAAAPPASSPGQKNVSSLSRMLKARIFTRPSASASSSSAAASGPPPVTPSHAEAGKAMGAGAGKPIYNVTICAMYAYTADASDPRELSFAKDEVLEAVETSASPWWSARNGAGKTGIVPSNYFEVRAKI